jgi:hypothetical protein
MVRGSQVHFQSTKNTFSSFFYQFYPPITLYNTAACYRTVSFSFSPADEPAVLSTTSLHTSLLHLEHRCQRRPPGIKAPPPLERLRAPACFHATPPEYPSSRRVVLPLTPPTRPGEPDRGGPKPPPPLKWTGLLEAKEWSGDSGLCPSQRRRAQLGGAIAMPFVTSSRSSSSTAREIKTTARAAGVHALRKPRHAIAGLRSQDTGDAVKSS